MPLKDEDFLLKQTKDIDKAMEDLGIQLTQEQEDEWTDPVDQYGFDLDNLEEKPKENKEEPKKKKPFWRK